MPKILPILLALILMFSGCLGLFEDDPDVDADDDADDGNGDGDTNGNQTADGNQTDDGDGDGDDNTTAAPPEASLSANVTNGSAPLSVEFELDNENPDAESVSWSLDLGEGDPETGDELPATVEHTYSDAGNYTVVLTLTSGDEEDTAEVTITVEEEAAGGPNDLVEGTNGDCLDYLILWAAAGVHSPLAEQVTVDPGTTWEATTGEYFAFVDFYDADGAFIEGTGGAGGTGEVPENAAYALLCVTVTETWPSAPVPAAAWTYQDGF